MLKQSEVIQAGRALFEAEKTRKQIGLLSLKYPHMDMDDAYRIQNEFVTNKLQSGEKQIGWKIGLTSKAMRKALDIDIPDSGVLFESMYFQNGDCIPRERFIQPRVEAEIVFFIKSDINEATEEAIIAATDYISPSIEILDTRIIRKDPVTNQTRKVVDTIADNAANAGIVVGKQKHNLQAIDLRWVGVIFKRNGVVEETGLGASVLDNPLTSMVWLVERLAKYNQKIRAGDIVLSGSFIKIVEAPTGSEIEADFGDFGSIDLRFE